MNDDPEDTAPDIHIRLRVNPENTFENFKAIPGTEKVLRAVAGVVSGQRPIGLIYGVPGNGKTHLLHAASIALYKMGYFVRVYEYSNILNTLRRSIGDNRLDYNDILDRYCLAERLIIDDIGAAGSDTEFSGRILESLVCSRYASGLMTLMSTNADLKDLPERVYSRLTDKTVCYLVQNEAPDFRPEKK